MYDLSAKSAQWILREALSRLAGLLADCAISDQLHRTSALKIYRLVDEANVRIETLVSASRRCVEHAQDDGDTVWMLSAIWADVRMAAERVGGPEYQDEEPCGATRSKFPH